MFHATHQSITDGRPAMRVDVPGIPLALVDVDDPTPYAADPAEWRTTTGAPALPARYSHTAHNAPRGVPVVTVYRMTDGLTRVGVAGAQSLEHAHAVAATAGHDYILAADGLAGPFPASWDRFAEYPGASDAPAGEVGAYYVGVNA